MRSQSALNFGAMNRALALVLADVLQVAPTQTEVDEETNRFRNRRGIQTDVQLLPWLKAHGLTRESFEALMRELATCRRLHRRLIVRDRGTQRTRWLLDELRLRDRYLEVAEGAAQQARVLQARDAELGQEVLPEEGDLEALVADHRHASGWHVAVPLDIWAEEAGFSAGPDPGASARGACARKTVSGSARSGVRQPGNGVNLS